MIRAGGAAVSLVALAALAGCAGTKASGDMAPAAASAEAAGYLSEERLAEIADRVPPAPVAGSAQDLDDRARSDAYRILAGGDRWLLATAHAEVRPELARQHFDCALGVRFQGQATPRLNAALARVLHDAETAAERVKARAHRPRPVGDDPERVPCQRVSPVGRASASYPSGSATVGAAYGEVFAAIDPDHAPAAREIGRQIAVSRAVCGMHYDTDVREGVTLGRAVATDIVASPAFRADLPALRAEVAAVRATGLTNAGCVAEAAALALPLPSPETVAP